MDGTDFAISKIKSRRNFPTGQDRSSEDREHRFCTGRYRKIWSPLIRLVSLPLDSSRAFCLIASQGFAQKAKIPLSPRVHKGNH